MSIHASAEPFRFAAVGDGGPVAGTETDPRCKRRMLRFLGEATRVVEDPYTPGPDLLDPERPARVPRAYRTDGRWIWPEALRFYLDRYDVALPAEFAAGLDAQGYRPPRVTAARVGQARAVLSGHATGRYEPPAPAQDRFPPEVYDVLVTYGWQPGAPLAGLTVPVYGTGIDVPVTGFELFAAPDDGGAVGAVNGAPIVRAGDGFHVSGRFLGTDLDRAVTSLIQGRTG